MDHGGRQGEITMNEMSEKLARQMLAAAQTELDGMEAERDRLTRMRDLCGEWLTAHGFGIDTEEVATTQVVPPTPVMSYPDAIRRILREANGQAVHRRDIASRAVALGVSTKAKNVMPIVDTALRRLRESDGAENVGKGYWRIPMPVLRKPTVHHNLFAQRLREVIESSYQPAIQTEGPPPSPTLGSGLLERG